MYVSRLLSLSASLRLLSISRRRKYAERCVCKRKAHQTVTGKPRVASEKWRRRYRGKGGRQDPVTAALTWQPSLITQHQGNAQLKCVCMDTIVLYIKGILIFLSFISRLLWFRERSAGGFQLIACTFPYSSIKARPPFPLTIYSTAATREDQTGDKTQARKNRKRI